MKRFQRAALMPIGLPVASLVLSLMGSLIAHDPAWAQFRYGRFGGGFGISIGIGTGGLGYNKLGYGGPGFGYGGYRYGSFGYRAYPYGGLGYGGYGISGGLAAPVAPFPAYRSPLYRAPVYRPATESFSLRIQSRPQVRAPRGGYVYPEASPIHAAPAVSSDASIGYQAARPIVPGGPVSDDFGNAAVIDVTDNLIAAATQLRQSLASRTSDADIWLDYLNPDLIIESVGAPDAASSLAPLLNNYEGLSGNADLSYIWTEPGFRETHEALRAFVDASVVVSDQPTLPPQPQTGGFESLPIPEAKIPRGDSVPGIELDNKSEPSSDAMPSSGVFQQPFGRATNQPLRI